MRTLLPALLASAFLATPVAAAATICKTTTKDLSPIVLAWNMETGEAKAQLRYRDPIPGRVTMTRPHEPHGVKVNLFFEKTNDPISDDIEFIVFPVGKNQYRVLGVGYQTIDGKGILNVGMGNHEADCQTI